MQVSGFRIYFLEPGYFFSKILSEFRKKIVALHTGINQADISKLENGTRNPSLKLLKRLADGMGMDLKLVFTPKEPQNLKLAK